MGTARLSGALRKALREAIRTRLGLDGLSAFVSEGTISGPPITSSNLTAKKGRLGCGESKALSKIGMAS